MLKDSIYEFSEFLDAVNDIFYQDPEFPPSEEEIENTLALIDQVAELENKQVDEIARQFIAAKQRAENIRSEARRLSDKAKSIESNMLRFKERLMETIIAKSPTRKFKGDVYSLSVRYTPSVCIDNMDALPKEFIKTKTEVSADKIALRKALKEGDVAGCHIENNPSLQVA